VLKTPLFYWRDHTRTEFYTFSILGWYTNQWFSKLFLWCL